MLENSTICMWISWLVMLRQTPETSIGTSIVRKKDTQGIPPLKRKNGKGVAQSDLEKAEEFNGQFTDVFSKNEHTQVPLLDRSATFMNDIAVSKDGVIKLLKGLNPSKALGPDELRQNRSPVFLYWPFQGGTSVVVPYCSCCLCLYFGSSIMLVTYFVNFR